MPPTESANENLDWLERRNEMSLSDSSHINCPMSTDSYTEKTISSITGPKEALTLFPSILDVFSEGEISPRVLNILSLMRDSILDLNVRLTAMEIQASKKAVSSDRMQWKDRLVLAEFRITENKGRMLQRDLQRKLGIGSRTTMSYLVNQLTSTGRYRKRREGRNNIIERIV